MRCRKSVTRGSQAEFLCYSRGQGRSETSGLTYPEGALLRLPARIGDAGWSSPVARQAHNLKVVGSNPAPATTGIAVGFSLGSPSSAARFPTSSNCIGLARS